MLICMHDIDGSNPALNIDGNKGEVDLSIRAIQH